MQKQNLRVVVASESPRVRSFLNQIIEEESGVDIVGQAQNAVKALALARELRPNIVILDYYLPYSTGLDTIPLSRMSGLDVAQAISEEIPRTKVVLLNNLDDRLLSADSLMPDSDGGSRGYCMAIGGKCISIAQWPETAAVGSTELVFASIAAREGKITPQKTANVFDKLIFFGALFFGAGWLLTLTIFLAPAGVVMAGLGALTAIVGFTGKLVVSTWRKMRRTEKQLAR